MACNVINDQYEFEIGLKRTIDQGKSLLHQKIDHTTMHHTPTSARKSPAN
jgi:hypothetical protein